MDATKRKLLAGMLDGWSEEELASFAILFDKFVSKFEETYPNESTGRVLEREKPRKHDLIDQTATVRRSRPCSLDEYMAWSALARRSSASSPSSG